MNDQSTEFYRYLKQGEVIQHGDEYRISDTYWDKCNFSIGSNCSVDGVVRRPILGPSHRPANLPESLPDPPAPPVGTCWAYRGLGWENEYSKYMFMWEESGSRSWSGLHSLEGARSNGCKDCHYLEAVPITTTEPPFSCKPVNDYPSLTFSTKSWEEINGLQERIRDLVSILLTTKSQRNNACVQADEAKFKMRDLNTVVFDQQARISELEDQLDSIRQLLTHR